MVKVEFAQNVRGLEKFRWQKEQQEQRPGGIDHKEHWARGSEGRAWGGSGSYPSTACASCPEPPKPEGRG